MPPDTVLEKNNGWTWSTPFCSKWVGKTGCDQAPWKTRASTPLPLACEASALPFELDSHCGPETLDVRIELTASRLIVGRSNNWASQAGDSLKWYQALPMTNVGECDECGQMLMTNVGKCDECDECGQMFRTREKKNNASQKKQKYNTF